MEMTIEQAKLFLEEQGYYTESLWSVNDVMDSYQCDKKQALDILDKALSSEWVTEQVFGVISDIAEEMGLQIIND